MQNVIKLIYLITGTFISSFATCCCSKLDHPERGYCTHFWVNLSVAWLQIFTVWMFLFGWIWSIAWGVQFIIKSSKKFITKTHFANQCTKQHTSTEIDFRILYNYTAK